MKLIQIAVASIVDANTGYRLDRNPSSSSYHGKIEESHALRAKTIFDLAGSLYQAIESVADYIGTRIKQRRDLARLIRLDDRLLRDIGLSRADLNAVSHGLGGSGRSGRATSCRYPQVETEPGIRQGKKDRCPGRSRQRRKLSRGKNAHDQRNKGPVGHRPRSANLANPRFDQITRNRIPSRQTEFTDFVTPFTETPQLRGFEPVSLFDFDTIDSYVVG